MLFILKQIVGYLIGKQVFSKIIEIVTHYESATDMTGEQKRQLAIEEAGVVCKDLASNLLNFAIEAALVVIRKKFA